MVGVKKVKENFERDNPGLTLSYTGARDLNRQVRLWVDNSGVNLAAAGLSRSAISELKQTVYAETPDEATTAKFKKFLKTRRVFQNPATQPRDCRTMVMGR